MYHGLYKKTLIPQKIVALRWTIEKLKWEDLEYRIPDAELEIKFTLAFQNLNHLKRSWLRFLCQAFVHQTLIFYDKLPSSLRSLRLKIECLFAAHHCKLCYDRLLFSQVNNSGLYCKFTVRSSSSQNNHFEYMPHKPQHWDIEIFQKDCKSFLSHLWSLVWTEGFLGRGWRTYIMLHNTWNAYISKDQGEIDFIQALIPLFWNYHLILCIYRHSVGSSLGHCSLKAVNNYGGVNYLFKKEDCTV